QRSSVGFTACAVFPKQPVTRAYRCVATAERVPCQTDTWRGIEKVALHAASGHSVDAALHEPVRNYGVQIAQVQRNRRQPGSRARTADDILHKEAVHRIDVYRCTQGLVISLWFPVIRSVLGVVPGTEKASPEANVDRKTVV